MAWVDLEEGLEEPRKLLKELLRDLVVVTLCWEGKTLKNITSPGVWLEQGENASMKKNTDGRMEPCLDNCCSPHLPCVLLTSDFGLCQ